MFDDRPQMTRRTALKASGLGVGTLGLGGGALFLASQPALAAEFTVSDADPVTTDDGSIDFVRLQADHRLEWDGFDTDVEYLRYVDTVTVRPNSDDVSRVIYDETSEHLDNWSSQGSGSDGWGGPDEYTSGSGKAGYAESGIDWNIIGDPNASDPENGGARSVEDPADLIHLLEQTNDGESKESLVEIEKKVLLLDGDQNEIRRSVATADFLVTVNNEEATTDSSGSGDASAGGTNEEP